MQFIGVDLGSTNMKAAVYDEQMKRLAWESEPVIYDRTDGFVEFDAEQYFEKVMALLRNIAKNPAVLVTELAQISFTGQAESLVVLDRAGKPLMRAISWMDERSEQECRILQESFTPSACEAVTGQMAILPTWPATKILWLRSHRPEIFENADKYMLLKDYIVYRMTGVMQADCSIATFSFYFDIYNQCYWKEMLDAIGIEEHQLPPLSEPCAVVGALTAQAAQALRFPATVRVNQGTLDHFAGMLGTGNVTPGGVSLSIGTVMALATMTQRRGACGVAMHYGFIPDTYVMLPVAESGGISLDWFKRACMKDVSYEDINRILAERTLPNDLLFLPYLVGVNAPEFDAEASGAFFGLRVEHDAFDMAAAVMEGVCFLLRKNCDRLCANAAPIDRIIATGGGARSAIWNQMQADITGFPLEIPEEKEAACLGAALVAAVAEGCYHSYQAAAASCVRMEKRFTPRPNARYERKYRQFCALYEAMRVVTNLE